MRISTYNQFGLMKYNMSRLEQDQIKLQTQSATGKYFQKLSEEPIRANQSLVIQNSLNQIDQYTKNVQDARSFLEAVESNLGTVVDIMQEARDQGLKAANSTFSQENRDTFASLLDQNIYHIESIANAKFLGKQLFAGEKTQTKPFTFDGTTATYNGDMNSPSIQISPNVNVKISENGEKAFRDVFEAMVQLRDNVKSGSIDDIQTAIGQLDKALGGLVDLRSEVGVRMEGMDIYKKSYETEKVGLQIKQSDVEEVDFTETYSNFVQNQQVYRGILTMTQKMFNISLLNYIS